MSSGFATAPSNSLSLRPPAVRSPRRAMSATSVASCDTVYSADAIEFCPVSPRIFVCGTYQIQQNEEEEEKEEAGVVAKEENEGSSSPSITRYGRCLLYQVDEEGRDLRELQRFDGPAILDMKWSPMTYDGRTTLAIADAEGHVQLHGFDETTNRLSPLSTVSCASGSTLCLSLDWSTRGGLKGPADLVVSLSSGEICTLGPASTGELRVLDTWHGHDYEPWIAAFDCWEPNTIWTGGDDLKLKGWDLRQGCSSPTFVNKRFDGGVTTIQSHPLIDHLFAVGSYDSQIRLFDKRKPLVPLSTFDAGGGLWRLKWHPTNPDRLLAACMHDGFKIVDWKNGFEGQGTLTTRFDEHESLAYGVDWGATRSDGKDVVASCSFYDHMLHVWAA